MAETSGKYEPSAGVWKYGIAACGILLFSTALAVILADELLMPVLGFLDIAAGIVFTIALLIDYRAWRLEHGR